MAITYEMSWAGIGIRFMIAWILVFATYNPEGYSYINWIFMFENESLPLKLLVGVVLVIGWAIYIRATRRSLGMIGMVLAIAFFATLLWLFVDWQIIPADSIRAVSYIILFIIGSLLATGMCWSHIRRRISGQMDVDEIEG